MKKIFNMLNPFSSNESIKTETTLANYHTESNNSQSLNHSSILNHHHHHHHHQHQQQQHGMRQNNQFLNSSVLCSNSLTNCYTSNNSMLRSHDGQLLLNNNNVENNFYLSSNHNEYKFNPNILTQQNQQLNHHGGFHDTRYNYSYGGSLSGDSSIEKNTISPNSGTEFYRNVDSATAAAVAIAAVSNQNQLNYNSGAFLRYIKQPTAVKPDLICKWIDQDSNKICNKIFTRMEDIGKFSSLFVIT
jgi:hypothetical protein